MSVEILVIGALHLDVIVDAPRFPRTDETVVGTSVAYRLGGKGGNQAVSAARMGAPTAMAGRVGSDGFGARIRRSLDAAGVDISQVRQSVGASGMSIAVVDARGDYGAVIVSGANREIDPAEIELPATLGALLLQSEIPDRVNQAVIARAPESCRVILNAAPAREAPQEDSLAAGPFAGVDILVVNRVEAASHAGLTTEAFDPLAAADRLLEMGPKTVIVTLGAAGLALRTAGDDAVRIPGRKVGVASTHGAGDVFVGTLAAELTAGAGLLQAAEVAQAAAALWVSTVPELRDRMTAVAVRRFLRDSPPQAVELCGSAAEDPGLLVG